MCVYGAIQRDTRSRLKGMTQVIASPFMVFPKYVIKFFFFWIKCPTVYKMTNVKMTENVPSRAKYCLTEFPIVVMKIIF